MADHTDSDFKAEYAKSNRASCKMCKGGINKDTLRLAIMVQVSKHHVLDKSIIQIMFKMCLLAPKIMFYSYK